MLSTVLFDLDGTLLPFSEEAFTREYFKGLAAKLGPLGFEPEALIKAVWAGTKAMVMNDGAATNDVRFWDTFCELTACDYERTRGLCDDFYTTTFDAVRAVVGPAEYSAKVVRQLRDKGYTVALATNPVFPMVAVRTRLHWIGLELSDFAVVTSYEGCRFCKPNPNYYQGILNQLGAQPQDCLMIGNSVPEDMCFAQMGGRVYLVTDHMENPKGLPFADYPQGSFEALAAYIDALPAI